MRVCLDSNVLVSAFATRGLASDVLRLTLAEHELIIPEVVLVETLRVLERKIHLPGELLDGVRELLRRQTLVPSPASHGPLALAKADASVVASAVAAKADLLVTGDAEMLAVGQHHGLPIIGLRAFWERLTGKTGGA